MLNHQEALKALLWGYTALVDGCRTTVKATGLRTSGSLARLGCSSIKITLPEFHQYDTGIA
jgi:hypothetical protein